MDSEVRLSFTVECTSSSRHWAPLKRITSLGAPLKPEVFITSPSFRILELNIHFSSSSAGNPAMLARILPPCVSPVTCPFGRACFSKSYSKLSRSYACTSSCSEGSAVQNLIYDCALISLCFFILLHSSDWFAAWRSGSVPRSCVTPRTGPCPGCPDTCGRRHAGRL